MSEKLNATLKYNSVDLEIVKRSEILFSMVENHAANGTLDFYLEIDFNPRGALYSYSQMDYCFQLGKPPSYSVTELVLILPFDA